MTEIEIIIKDETADAVEALGRITGQAEPGDVIFAALRSYAWILARQTKGSAVISPPVPGVEVKNKKLTDYVKDRDEALRFFKGTDLYER